MEGPSSSPTASPPAPPSPGIDPINLSDGIKELLFFTLSSSVHGTLEVDFSLSRDYCRRLIQGDPHPELLTDFVATCTTGDSVGIPSHPLYKHLACRIERCINQCDLMILNPTVGCAQSGFLKQKEKDWKKLIADVGSELINMFNSVDFELHVQEPFFSQLKAGQKTIEGRCAVGNYKRIAPGNVILMNKCLLLRVQHVKFYDSFSEMLEFESLTSVLPGVKTIIEGVQIYQKFYSKEKEKMSGVVAISVSRATAQPYILIAKLLNGLSYDGIASLLGLAHTAGTVPGSLPPAVSVLISSFMSLHRPEVRGSSLSNGARALSKHVSRSSNGWWCEITGSDSNKNHQSLRTLILLMGHCCWMNVYMTRFHGELFEIRVADGYGARWSKEGSKFVGFIEPYMKDGHSRRGCKVLP